MSLVNPAHLLFVGVIALLVLGPKRLPEVARTIGNALHEFRQALDMSHQPQQPPAPVAPPVAAPPAPVPPVTAPESD